MCLFTCKSLFVPACLRVYHIRVYMHACICTTSTYTCMPAQHPRMHACICTTCTYACMHMYHSLPLLTSIYGNPLWLRASRPSLPACLPGPQTCLVRLACGPLCATWCHSLQSRWGLGYHNQQTSCSCSSSSSRAEYSLTPSTMRSGCL